MKPLKDPDGLRLQTGAKGLLVALLLLGVTAGAGAAEPMRPSWRELQEKYLQASRNEHDARVKGWTEVAAWNFDDDTLPASFRPFEGEWKVQQGSLRAMAGKKDHSRTIKIADCSWPAFRLEFDATLYPNPGDDPTRVGDIGIRFNADPATGAFAKAYTVITAQYGNQATVLYRLNIPYARTEWSPIVPGKRHHVALEVVSPHIRFWVDGRVVLDAWERSGLNNRDLSDFMPMDPRLVMALSTYDNVMEVDNLRILVPLEKPAGAGTKPAKAAKADAGK
jgi:hypothetical protein